METRICSGECGKEKLLTIEFYHFDKRWNTFDPMCNICRNERAREWYKKNKDKHDENHKNYTRSEVGRNNYYKQKGYKINDQDFTVEDYNKLFEEQKGICPICKEKLKKGRLTHVDHNHKTGKIRGLLCTKCNRSLGGFDESIIKLQNAIIYLQQ